jgi:hypothetical protein
MLLVWTRFFLMNNSPEIVLATMVANFKVEPSQEIFFELIGISHPTVKGAADGKHQLPMKLSLLPSSGM